MRDTVYRRDCHGNNRCDKMCGRAHLLHEARLHAKVGRRGSRLCDTFLHGRISRHGYRLRLACWQDLVCQLFQLCRACRHNKQCGRGHRAREACLPGMVNPHDFRLREACLHDKVGRHGYRLRLTRLPGTAQGRGYQLCGAFLARQGHGIRLRRGCFRRVY